MENVIALDIGNGYGKAAILESKDAAPVFLLDADMRCGMNTTAYVTPNGVIEVNKKITQRRPGRAVYNVKTHFDKERIEFEEAGIKYFADPAKVYGAVALELISLANETLKNKKKTPSYRVVVTYPASFINTNKPEIMKKSIEDLTLDGHKIEVIAMLPEPSAAAVDAIQERIKSGNATDNVVGLVKIVYDLGHGTFDAVLVTSTGNANDPFDAVAHNADPEIGGRVFDKKIADNLLRQLGYPDTYTPNSIDMDTIEHTVAVNMKHALSDQDIVFENFVKQGDGYYNELSLTAEQFRQLIINDLNTTHAKIFELLGKAEEKNLKVDEIILTGGSCNIPFVKTYLEEVLKSNEINIPVNRYKPENAVVFGAARYAFTYTPVQTEDVPAPGNDNPPPSEDPNNPPITIIQHTESNYCVRAGDGVALLIDREAILPAKSDALDIICNGPTAEIIICRTRNGKNFTKQYNTENYQEVRRFSFDVYPNKKVSIQLHIDDNRFITVTCKTPDGKNINQHK